eukprot:30828-Pelagococcus_subviridis.AAC.27
MHHERGERLTGPRRRGEDDVQRQRQLLVVLHGSVHRGVVRVELLEEVVLVLVHPRDATGLRAAFIRPQVHRREGLVFDAVGALIPHDLRGDRLDRVRPVLEGFASQEQVIRGLRVHDRVEPSHRVLAVLAHRFDFV